MLDPECAEWGTDVASLPRKPEPSPPPAIPQGPYTVWEDGSYGWWRFTDYPSLDAALRHQSLASTWIIQKPVSYEVRELTAMPAQKAAA